LKVATGETRLAEAQGEIDEDEFEERCCVLGD